MGNMVWFPYAPLHCEMRKTLHMDSKVLVYLKKKPGQRRKAVRSDYPEVALRIIHRLYKVCRMHRTGGSKRMHIRVRQLLPPGLTAQGVRRSCAMERGRGGGGGAGGGAGGESKTDVGKFGF